FTNSVSRIAVLPALDSTSKSTIPFVHPDGFDVTVIPQTANVKLDGLFIELLTFSDSASVLTYPFDAFVFWNMFAVSVVFVKLKLPKSNSPTLVPLNILSIFATLSVTNPLKSNWVAFEFSNIPAISVTFSVFIVLTSKSVDVVFLNISLISVTFVLVDITPFTDVPSNMFL